MKDHDEISLYVAMPCEDAMKSKTSSCLAAALLHANNNLDCRLQFAQDQGTIIQSQRTSLAKTAIDAGATHIVWIDSDMTFPADAITRLVSHKVPFVGTNYSTRRWPHHPTAKAADYKTYLYTDYCSRGLEEAGAIGFGLALTETSLFVGTSEPWFDVTATYEGEMGEKHAMIGEDYWFCYLVGQELGVAPYVDHDLSRLVGHIGEKTFSFEDAIEDRPLVRLIRSKAIPEQQELQPHQQFASWNKSLSEFPDEEFDDIVSAYRQRAAEREETEETRILQAAGVE